MKRTALLLGLVSVIGALSVACSDDAPDTLSNESRDTAGNIAGDDDDSDKKTTSDKTDPAPTTQKDAPAPVTTSANTAACDPKAAKTAQECTKCCAEQASPATKKLADSCACGTGSKCGDKCGDSLCSGGGFPSIECGLCLFQAKCEIGDLAGDLGNLGGQAGTDAAACFKTCEDKPTE